MLLNRLIRGCVKLKTEHRGKADRAEHPEVILLEAVLGVSDRADDACIKISPSVDVVHNLAGLGLFKEAVDGEVTSGGIFLRRCKGDGCWMASVRVGAVGAEGCHVKREAIAQDKDNPERFSDRDGLAFEECFDLVGRGRCGNVDIFQRTSEQSVSHAPTCEERLMSSRLQCACDGARGGEHGCRDRG